MDQGKDQVADSPTEIREAIAQARADLGRHLSALSNPLLPSEGDSPGGVTMSTEKNTKPASSKSKGAKAATTTKTKAAPSASAKTKPTASKTTKSTTPSKSSAAKTKPTSPQASAKSTKKSTSSKSSTAKSATARKGKSVAAKAGQVLDTMAAGAVVGAVQAAAQSIAQSETPSVNSLHGPTASTREVLGEMAPDAALGAVVGAAQAIIPEASEPEEGKSKTKPKASRSSKKTKS